MSLFKHIDKLIKAFPSEVRKEIKFANLEYELKWIQNKIEKYAIQLYKMVYNCISSHAVHLYKIPPPP